MKKVKVLCLGKRFRDGDLRMVFDTMKGESIAFKFNKRRMNGALPGRYYELEDNGDGTWKLPNSWWENTKELGAVQDIGYRTQLQTLDRAAELEAEAVRSRHPELDDVVARLRAARQAMGNRQGAAFDAWLLREVRK